MNKICGYNCEHNKGGQCQITYCDKIGEITTTTQWLSGGRQQGKTYQLIKNQQKEIERLKEVIQKNDKEIDNLCNNQKKEIERLKNGYCELKVKCNNGECDCTNEEYDGMVESNIKLSLENDELRNILEKMGTNPNEILYLKNEVDRLNNIIDELEKYHIKSMENLENTEDFKYVGTNHIKILYEEHKRTLDKLKELKEGKE